MSYLFEDKDNEINGVSDLLSLLKKHQQEVPNKLKLKPGSKPIIWFRGLKDIGLPLLPTFHRPECKVKDEVYLMNVFKQNAHQLLTQIPRTEWEWMFLMRHHKSPSRLLDWTENPLVGLYFAVCPGEQNRHKDADGVLWCLLPTQLNHLTLKWPLEDNSLPMLSGEQTERSQGASEIIPLYSPSVLKGFTGPSPLTPVAGICPRTNLRMQIQMSVFTLHHADKKPIEDIGDGTHIWRYKIPHGNKESLLQELKNLGIMEATLFPTLDNTAADAARLVGGE
jgi:hypothetical protein